MSKAASAAALRHAQGYGVTGKGFGRVVHLDTSPQLNRLRIQRGRHAKTRGESAKDLWRTLGKRAIWVAKTHFLGCALS